ncbi:LLM class flavin-dependent oxidoreductase [Actinospica robiniae]|uniref:LLM class flavin-dependent oxidoreductase n=1 Tax=Actinospica robiniae TaxID=304901 RepID=UPI000422EBDB|nr:LLM class flavin-dependent oxidoreductase [Actinospica robiniae]
MDLYYLSLGDHLPDPATGVRAGQGERLREILEAAVYAEALGFTGVGVGEHHFHDYIVSAPEILLAAIAARTTRLRLGTAVTLLAHADPVRVAEELAMLDALSAGRAQLCVARGVSARTWAAFGSDDEDDVRARLETNLRLLLRLLDESEVRWSGNTRAPLDAVTIQPRPCSAAPEPRVWLGAGFSPRSADLAAELGLPLLLPSTLHPPQVHLPVVARYRQTLAHRGEGHRARVGLPVHVHVAESDDQAVARWTPHLHTYASFAGELRGTGKGTQSIGDLLEGPAICGSPRTVATRLDKLVAEFGLDALYVLMDIGAMPAEDVHASMRLFAEEVVPLLAVSSSAP